MTDCVMTFAVILENASAPLWKGIYLSTLSCFMSLTLRPLWPSQ
jgi:hypothetical protein